jgi:hypothetical protein
MTIICLGISFSFKASVEVITRSLSTLTKGKVEGLEPVAIMVFFASIVCESLPSILI